MRSSRRLRKSLQMELVFTARELQELLVLAQTGLLILNISYPLHRLLSQLSRLFRLSDHGFGLKSEQPGQRVEVAFAESILCALPK